jgi:hypothetical protein
MSHGPGKYDDACSRARLATEADGVALIVLYGRFGSGFSVQGSPELLPKLPVILRIMADQIERDLAQDAPEGDS